MICGNDQRPNGGKSTQNIDADKSSQNIDEDKSDKIGGSVEKLDSKEIISGSFWPR